MRNALLKIVFCLSCILIVSCQLPQYTTVRINNNSESVVTNLRLVWRDGSDNLKERVISTIEVGKSESLQIALTDLAWGIGAGTYVAPFWLAYDYMSTPVGSTNAASDPVGNFVPDSETIITITGLTFTTQ